MTPKQVREYLPPVLARAIDRLAAWWMNFPVPAASQHPDDFDDTFTETPAPE